MGIGGDSITVWRNIGLIHIYTSIDDGCFSVLAEMDSSIRRRVCVCGRKIEY